MIFFFAIIQSRRDVIFVEKKYTRNNKVRSTDTIIFMSVLRTLNLILSILFLQGYRNYVAKFQ